MLRGRPTALPPRRPWVEPGRGAPNRAVNAYGHDRRDLGATRAPAFAARHAGFRREGVEGRVPSEPNRGLSAIKRCLLSCTLGNGQALLTRVLYLGRMIEVPRVCFVWIGLVYRAKHPILLDKPLSCLLYTGHWVGTSAKYPG